MLLLTTPYSTRACTVHAFTCHYLPQNVVLGFGQDLATCMLGKAKRPDRLSETQKNQIGVLIQAPSLRGGRGGITESENMVVAGSDLAKSSYE